MVLRGALARQVPCATVDVLVHALALLADLVRPGGVRIPPEDRGIVHALVVRHATPVALVAVAEVRLADRPRAAGPGEQRVAEVRGRQVRPHRLHHREEQRRVRGDDTDGVVGRRRRAGEPLVDGVRPGGVGVAADGQLGDAECVLPLCLVVGAGERGDVHQCARRHEPLGEVLLGGGLTGEVPRGHGVRAEDDGGDTGGLHLADHLRGLGLDGCRVQFVGDDLRQRSAHRLHLVGEPLGKLRGRVAAVQVHQAEAPLLPLHRLASVRCRLADHLLLEELQHQGLLLDGTAVQAPDVGIAVLVELGRLAGRAAHAEDLAGGQLVGEGVGERRATEHRERVVLLGDRRGIGTGGDVVVGQAGALVGDEVDLAAVHLVVRLVVLHQAAHGLELLGVGVVGGDRIRDVGDDRVALEALVVDDGDLVGGHPVGRRASVVAAERGVALRREVVRHRDAPGGGVAAVAPVDLVGDALLHRLGVRQRVSDLTATTTRGGCGRVAHGGVGAGTGGTRRIGAGDRGARRRIVVAPRGHEHTDADGGDRDDAGDRPPPLQLAVPPGRPRARRTSWLHGYPLVPLR